MNIERLQAVKAAILKEPRNALMEEFHARPANTIGGFRIPGSTGSYNSAHDASCGTAHCIAGWAVAIFGDSMYEQGIAFVDDYACELLEIEHGTLGCWPGLFYLDEWPDDLYDRYMESRTDQERAEAMAAAIDSYIETGGWPKAGA